MDFSGALTKLFDYQRFEENKKLQALVDDTKNRCFHHLADDALEWVSAAGEESLTPEKKDGKADA